MQVFGLFGKKKEEKFESPILVGRPPTEEEIKVHTNISALDVAKYILEKQGPMELHKLHKLVYYAQAWHLVWDKEVLFEDEIHAWAIGPVIPTMHRLFLNHKWVTGEDVHNVDADLLDRAVETARMVFENTGIDVLEVDLSELEAAFSLVTSENSENVCEALRRLIFCGIVNSYRGGDTVNK